MKTSSLWQDIKGAKFARLTKSSRYDVVVVGGGITGLTTAYLLKGIGKKVCLLERGNLGAGDTGYTSAHLTYVTDKRLPALVRTFGKEGARLAWSGGETAIHAIESIAAAEKIDCEFRRVPGFLHASLEGNQDESTELEKEAQLAQELDFDARFVKEVPYFKKPGVVFSNQAKFHPLKYLQGLAGVVQGEGCDIFQQSEVTSVEDDPLTVIANDRRIECDYVVIATHVPLMGKANTVSAALFQTKQYPYSTYVVGARVPKGVLPEASFWDTTDPYYYVRIDRGAKQDYVIFGGSDHKTGQAADTEESYHRLEEMLHKNIPMAIPDRRWSGQVIETNDGLPFIGETSERQFVATGFSGNGMTFGTLAGIMACDRIRGAENPWQKLFDVHRKKMVGSAWHYVTENFDYPYYFLKDRIGTAAGQYEVELKPGEAQVVMIQGERVACHCDDEGKLETVSAICTHMGCVVRWNTAEKTWDCPCHGSRFHADGAVLAGPAETPLPPWKGKLTSKLVKASEKRKQRPTKKASAKKATKAPKLPAKPTKSPSRPGSAKTKNKKKLAKKV